MSNGRLVSPSAVSVKSVPALTYEPKSMEWTFWPELASTPRGFVVPCATVSPSAFLSCQGSASVASVTRVAFLGPLQVGDLVDADPGTGVGLVDLGLGPAPERHVVHAEPPRLRAAAELEDDLGVRQVDG